MSMPQGHFAHLGYAELLTPDLDATVWFFENILGMIETRRVDGMSFLRAFDDYEECSIVAKQAPTSGIGRTALRATSEQALEERVVAIQAAGREGHWEEGIAGRGRTFVTTDPDGHEWGFYYDTVWYEAPEHLAAGLKNQAAAKPNKAVGVRRFDHINFLAASPPTNADWHTEVLGARPTEQIKLDDGTIAAKWMTYNSKSYDVVYTHDWTGSSGRLHHLAFATDTREEILRAADLCLDQGVHIETGPHKHAIQQTFFLYVFEPGGNRIELCNPLTRLVLAPDWPLVTWTQTERLRGQAWGLGTIETFHTHGTPPTEGQDPRTYRPTGMLGRRPSGDARR